MSHHGRNPFDGHDNEEPVFQKRAKLMRDLLNTTGFRGAIGDYPDGQLGRADEGGIQFAIGEQDGKVVIDFGTPVHWLGMTPQQAAKLANTLLERARLVARKNGETVSFIIGGR